MTNDKLKCLLGGGGLITLICHAARQVKNWLLPIGSWRRIITSFEVVLTGCWLHSFPFMFLTLSVMKQLLFYCPLSFFIVCFAVAPEFLFLSNIFWKRSQNLLSCLSCRAKSKLFCVKNGLAFGVVPKCNLLHFLSKSFLMLFASVLCFLLFLDVEHLLLQKCLL